MHAILQERRQEVIDACRQFGVERLDVFGSAARTDFDAEVSDLDFIVRFRSPGEAGYADRYLGLAEQLERVFGRRVDLLTERSLHNPVFIQTISCDREIVYES